MSYDAIATPKGRTARLKQRHDRRAEKRRKPESPIGYNVGSDGLDIAAFANKLGTSMAAASASLATFSAAINMAGFESSVIWRLGNVLGRVDGLSCLQINKFLLRAREDKTKFIHNFLETARTHSAMIVLSGLPDHEDYTAQELIIAIRAYDLLFGPRAYREWSGNESIVAPGNRLTAGVFESGA